MTTDRDDLKGAATGTEPRKSVAVLLAEGMEQFAASWTPEGEARIQAILSRIGRPA